MARAHKHKQAHKKRAVLSSIYSLMALFTFLFFFACDGSNAGKSDDIGSSDRSEIQDHPINPAADTNWVKREYPVLPPPKRKKNSRAHWSDLFE
ncbi:hypothetical protein SAMN04488121_102706 [Chitinophaga filiformis]|uniref:Uncharacterized protein n=1 Tax=Chitinophaga filiformis TaxID=104663 RepID=A0A1G7N8U4_CHIFI|nr:hypothetical protein SAMN04488121_102706 [Chitinophaga filiformis]